MKAVIFFAHGSRRPNANQVFYQLAEKVTEQLNLEVFEVAFVEKSLPSFLNSFKSCIKKGAASIRVYPAFLSSGIHLLRYLADEIQKARSAHSRITIRTALPLGEHPIPQGLVARIADEELR